MPEFVEFTGKSIDHAIESAQDHFGEPRERLEIEILQDAKSGLLGLVGARKAVIRALVRDTGAETRQIVKAIVERLIHPIAGSVPMEVELDEGRARVMIRDGDHTGLIIGREGQTLSALQYLANRIAARRLPEPVRVHIDTGDYRERQDENLRQMAQDLAAQAARTGRSQSTRPLSSYHRRVVHLTLQDDEQVNTRSKGEGPLKRVIILPRRKQRGGNGRGRSSGNNA